MSTEILQRRVYDLAARYARAARRDGATELDVLRAKLAARIIEEADTKARGYDENEMLEHCRVWLDAGSEATFDRELGAAREHLTPAERHAIFEAIKHRFAEQLEDSAIKLRDLLVPVQDRMRVEVWRAAVRAIENIEVARGAIAEMTSFAVH